MSTTDPLTAVQVGIRSLLTSDAALVALVSDRVYDEPPESTAGDYVLFRELRAVPGGSHAAPGATVTAVLESWTTGRSMLGPNEIAARLVALLDNGEADLDQHVTGHTVWMVKHRFSRSLRPEDRTMRGREDRFEISTEQA